VAESTECGLFREFGIVVEYIFLDETRNDVAELIRVCVAPQTSIHPLPPSDSHRILGGDSCSAIFEYDLDGRER
ncbi:hypothetical protein PENTCL1PPCAC_25995, partial [Pristionchus entomophagus]